MNQTFRLAASLVLLAGIAGCEPLGDGSTVKTMQVVLVTSEFEHGVMVPATEITPRYMKMYDCFCSNVAALATFTNGTVSNFSFRATFSSSDPSVVQVYGGDAADDPCPSGQRTPGRLEPRSVGTALITADFGGIRDTLEVRVTDTSLVSSAFTLTPPAPATTAEIAVSSRVQLQLRALLDGRLQSLNLNTTDWSLSPDIATVATINTVGAVTGIGPSGASPITARAAFPTCPVTVEAPVYIGDIAGPLTVEREAPDFAADALLAVNSDEFLTVTAPLDFDGDGIADGSQRVGNSSSLSFTDDCVLRTYDAANTTTQCQENAATCTQITPICSTTSTSCTSTTSCRVEAPSLLVASGSRIIAFADSPSPTLLSATFPSVLGQDTVLTAAIDADDTAITVGALNNYPSTETTWYGTITDADGSNREDVRVTGYEGTTLTVVRGISGGGGPAVPHAAGATFEQRSYASDSGTPLPITPREGDLTTVLIDAPGTLEPLSSLQLDARGTFLDDAAAERTQKITRLFTFAPGSPTLVWSSSDTSVARFSDFTPGLLQSRAACGGTVTVRARATTSTNTDSAAFVADSTTDDVACDTGDPLCDQAEVCIQGLDPLPDGTVCEDGPHDCTP